MLIRGAVALFALLLTGCLGDSETYRKDVEERQQRDRAIAAIQIFWTLKPDRPYEELGRVAVETDHDSERLNDRIRRAVYDAGGQAAIVTGQHSTDRLGVIVPIEATPYTDVVAIRWKP